MSLKINKRQFKLWIAALDSGEYKQDECRLQTKDGFCCLGVGCKVFIPEKLQATFEGRLTGQRPNEQPASPIWLQQINDDFDDKVGLSLTYINDAIGFTFPEIATLLELVYIHKILD